MQRRPRGLPKLRGRASPSPSPSPSPLVTNSRWREAERIGRALTCQHTLARSRLVRASAERHRPGAQPHGTAPHLLLTEQSRAELEPCRAGQGDKSGGLPTGAVNDDLADGLAASCERDLVPPEDEQRPFWRCPECGAARVGSPAARLSLSTLDVCEQCSVETRAELGLIANSLLQAKAVRLNPAEVDTKVMPPRSRCLGVGHLL